MVNITQDSATKSVDYVQFQDQAPQLSQYGAFILKIPNEQDSLEISPVYYDLQTNGDYVWLGKMSGEVGYAGLIKMSDRLAGFIQSQSGFWEIVPLADGISMIREMEISRFQHESCGIDHIFQTYAEGELQEMALDLCNNEGGCGGIIDVLILVPPDVRQWYGTQFENNWEVLMHVITSFFSFQMALINSGIEDITLRFRTAPFDFQYSNPLRAIDDVFINLPTSAADIRDEFRADLVVLLTSMDYPGVRGVARAGVFDENNQFNFLAPREDLAFVIAEVQNVVDPTWTLAHEIAHLFGARHNRSNNVPCENNCGDDEDICTHGFRFANNGQDRTIMALLLNDDVLGGSQRALHYSNPDVQFNGFDTGTENNNNTLGIVNATCSVQNFRVSPELGVTIKGTSASLCGLNGFVNPRTYEANVIAPAPGFPGAPPYTYEWRWNLDGNFTSANPGTLFSTASNVTINSVLGCPQFFLRVNVTASDGTTAHATRVIRTALCSGCQGQTPSLIVDGNDYRVPVENDNDLLSNRSLNAGKNQYIVSPNPSTDKLLITSLDMDDNMFMVKVFDTTGNKLWESKRQGTGHLEIDSSNFPFGMLWVQIYDDKGVHVERIIKVN